MSIEHITGERVIPSIDRRYDATLTVVGRLGQDQHRPFTSSFYGALGDCLGDVSDPIGQLHAAKLRQSIVDNPHYTPLNIARNYERSVTAMALWRRDEGYDRLFPLGKTTKAAWNDDLHVPFRDKFHESMFDKLLATKVNTNVGRRAAIITEIAAAYAIMGDRKFVEIGSSQQQIGLKLANHRNRQLGVMMSPVSVMQAIGDAPAPDQYTRDEAQSKLATHIARRHPLGVQSYLGIDIQDPRESIVRLKALRSSFYLEEMAKDWRRVKEYDKLESLLPRSPQVESKVIDGSDPLDPEDIWKEYPAQAGGADIGSLFYTLYLIKPAKRATAIQNMLSLLHEDGIGIIFDAVHVAQDGTTEVSTDWSPYSSTVSVFNKARPEAGWQTFFTVESGRAIRWVNEAPIGKLDGARELGMLPTRLAIGR